MTVTAILVSKTCNLYITNIDQTEGWTSWTFLGDFAIIHESYLWRMWRRHVIDWSTRSSAWSRCDGSRSPAPGMTSLPPCSDTPPPSLRWLLHTGNSRLHNICFSRTVLLFVKMFISLEEYYIKTRFLISQLINFDTHQRYCSWCRPPIMVVKMSMWVAIY